MALDPTERRAWRGVTANLRTIEMLEITEQRALRSLTPLRIPQGSYNAGGVSASGGTHDGGGVIDVSIVGMTADERNRVVRELRETSFAAWYRPYLAGVWPAHIHAVAIGDRELSPQAAWQVSEYKAGRNGLANQGPDNGPQVPIHVYRQEIDLSYYGPEQWDADDWKQFSAYVHGSNSHYVSATTGEDKSLRELVQWIHKAVAVQIRDEALPAIDTKVTGVAETQDKILAAVAPPEPPPTP